MSKTSKVYVVTDLGPGDGGKGGVVHKISHMKRAHTIIKRGGAQGSHGVRTSKGQNFAFSQWGCGTFEGVPTHLSRQMIITPEGLLNEANALRYEHGIDDPFRLLTVDEEALCATHYHQAASRLKELARGDNPRGTIGTGVGEAYRDLGRLPDLAIKARDLSGSGLRDQLAAVREQVRSDLQPIIKGEFLASDREAVQEEIDLLYDDEFLDFVVERFTQAGKRSNIVGSDYLGEVILAREGVAVVETSHGVLTDRLVGFHPHTSAIRTLPRFTHGLFEEAGYDGQIVNLGVTRAYAIRHGAGPMPTADPDMAERLLPGSNKDANRYQGEVRVGPMDFVLLRYAIQACGGPTAFDGLAITWFDQVQLNNAWSVCDSYVNSSTYTWENIELFRQPSLEQQAVLAKVLLRVQPNITTVPLDADASRDELYAVCAGEVEAALKVPVRMVSFGPTELDKLCK